MKWKEYSCILRKDSFRAKREVQDNVPKEHGACLLRKESVNVSDEQTITF